MHGGGILTALYTGWLCSSCRCTSHIHIPVTTTEALRVWIRVTALRHSHARLAWQLLVWIVGDGPIDIVVELRVGCSSCGRLVINRVASRCCAGFWVGAGAFRSACRRVCERTVSYPRSKVLQPNSSFRL